MKCNLLKLLLISACGFVVSCVPLTFDMKSWKRLSSRTTEIQGVTFSMELFPTYSNAVGNRTGGPWRINLHSKSTTSKDVRIVGVTMTCAEGSHRIYEGDAGLPQTQPWNDGSWQGYWIPEENPLSANPAYHPSQKLVIEIELWIDGGAKRTFSATFVPHHGTGRETVNLLTM